MTGPDRPTLLARDSAATATFLPNGKAPLPGEWFRNPDYARTLREIARDGPSTLYGGALGQRLVARVKALGGFLTLEDLKKNTPTWVTPISVPFKGYRRVGAAAQQPGDRRARDAAHPRAVRPEGDGAQLGAVPAPSHRGEEARLRRPRRGTSAMRTISRCRPARLLDDAFISERRSHIDANKAQARMDPGPLRTSSETIYLTVADSAGNMVSFINSLYDEFGSGIVVPGTGFALHDRGAGFTLEPGLPNTVAPGKRPFHTLIPAFVTKTNADGTESPYMSFGVMGGAHAGAGPCAVAAQHAGVRHGRAAGHRCRRGSVT